MLQQSQSPGAIQTRVVLERRLESRYPTNDPAEVNVLPAGAVHASGRVLDISRFGLRILLPISLPHCAEIKATLSPTVIVLGQVRYCLHAEAGFYVGIATREVIFPPEEQAEHPNDRTLALFAGGNGLAASEFLKLKHHLISCEECRTRLVEART